MRIAISNIAWDPAEDEAVARLLAAQGIDAIDIAPGKYFPRPAEATREQIAAVRQAWADRGIAVTGMQALLFGTSGLNLFGSAGVRQAMLDHLAHVCRIGAGLGATRLTFGSPKNRDRSGLDDAAAAATATDFFRRLGDIASDAGVRVCLEPNPPRYGANFMLDHAEAAAVVRAVAHPAIGLQLDTGALAIQGEPADATVADCAGLIGHVHASEPDLVPLGEGGTNHAAVAAALARHLPGHVVTIEMLATTTEPHLDAIQRALACAVRHYRAAHAATA
jgi:D-psicose/D-tagatose/L-ribulose 3-epimerase